MTKIVTMITTAVVVMAVIACGSDKEVGIEATNVSVAATSTAMNIANYNARNGSGPTAVPIAAPGPTAEPTIYQRKMWATWQMSDAMLVLDDVVDGFYTIQTRPLIGGGELVTINEDERYAIVYSVGDGAAVDLDGDYVSSGCDAENLDVWVTQTPITLIAVVDTDDDGRKDTRFVSMDGGSSISQVLDLTDDMSTNQC